MSLLLLNNSVEVTNNGELLPSRSHVVVYRATAQTLTNGVAATLIYTTEVVDALSEYDTGTGIFTATRAGKYASTWAALSDTNAWLAGEQFTATLYKNNSTDLDSRWGGYRDAKTLAHNGYGCSQGFAIVDLAAGDNLRVKVLQTSGGDLNTLNVGPYNYFHIVSLA